MKAPKIYGNEKQKRISEELRQLEQLSKGLRRKALRTLLDRNAGQHPNAKSVAMAGKAVDPVAVETVAA